MFKVNNRNTIKRCEIYSKLTIKQWRRSVVIDVVLVLLLLTLNISSACISDFEQVNIGWARRFDFEVWRNKNEIHLAEYWRLLSKIQKTMPTNLFFLSFFQRFQRFDLILRFKSTTIFTYHGFLNISTHELKMHLNKRHNSPPKVFVNINTPVAGIFVIYSVSMKKNI